jgi:hypothetical protein
MQNNQDIYGNMSYPAFLNGVVERLDEPSNWRACWFAVQNTSQMARV